MAQSARVGTQGERLTLRIYFLSNPQPLSCLTHFTAWTPGPKLTKLVDRLLDKIGDMVEDLGWESQGGRNIQLPQERR